MPEVSRAEELIVSLLSRPRFLGLREEILWRLHVVVYVHAKKMSFTNTNTLQPGMQQARGRLSFRTGVYLAQGSKLTFYHI
jgi:hypothetical protein